MTITIDEQHREWVAKGCKVRFMGRREAHRKCECGSIDVRQYEYYIIHHEERVEQVVNVAYYCVGCEIERAV